MREIKFRAWDSNQKRWIKLSSNYGTTFWENGKLMGAQVYIIIMQYTGLKDKNGREIYEGDWWRVQSSMAYSNGIETPGYSEGIVQWDGIHLYVGTLALWANGHIFYDGVGEVIGNQYENPELL